jgi:predicted dehydrogenase
VSAQTQPRPLRVAMIGHAFMGRAHSVAWRNVASAFEVATPTMSVVVGRNAERTAAAAARLGWAGSSTDWREVIQRDDIDVVDICTPGDSHAEIAIAALQAGKHVLCEKPLANGVPDAVAMTAAAQDAAGRGVRSMCGFSYRRTPALALAKRFVEQGRLGTIRHIRAQYLQDWLSDENAPMTWRLDRSKAGSGSLGDIGAHSIDAARFVTGLEIESVSALLTTFVPSRPVAGEMVGLGGRVEDPSTVERVPVTVDDAALFTARYQGGAVGSFEATRFALGRKNANRLEVNGSLGSIAFDFESMNTLQYYDGRDDADSLGFRTIDVTDAVHPYTGHWWPVGHGLGYDHVFTNQIADFIADIAADRDPSPSFEDALRVQRVLDAVERSAADNSRLHRVDEDINERVQ